VVPAAAEAAFPTLLDFPAPVLRVYSRESVIAEKLHAMVRLGQLNSRMKDFYDIWLLLRQCEFGGPMLCRAVAAVFARRDTPLSPELPLALTPAFGQDAEKVVQWRAFLSRTGLQVEDRRFEDIVAEVSNSWRRSCRPLRKERCSHKPGRQTSGGAPVSRKT
jgi:hypothetical protein